MKARDALPNMLVPGPSAQPSEAERGLLRVRRLTGVTVAVRVG